MLRVASWRSVRDVMVVHSNKSAWDASKLKLVKTCKIKTFKTKIPIIPNVDQKPTIQNLSVANVVLLTTAPKSQAGKFYISANSTAPIKSNLGGTQLPDKNGLTLVKKTLTTTTLDINFTPFLGKLSPFFIIKSVSKVMSSSM